MTFLKDSDLKINQLFYYFIIYSFLGWCIEMLYGLIAYGAILHKGVFNSPFCTIYGFGALILIVFLHSLKDNPLMLFLCSVFLTTMLELGTGLVMRKVFSITAWDYSSESLNLLGIVCLKYSLLWGLLSILMVYLLHPIVQGFVTFIHPKFKYVVPGILLLYFFCNLIVNFSFIP